eukprot:Awhi_evm1s14459
MLGFKRPLEEDDNTNCNRGDNSMKANLHSNKKWFDNYQDATKINNKNNNNENVRRPSLSGFHEHTSITDTHYVYPNQTQQHQQQQEQQALYHQQQAHYSNSTSNGFGQTNHGVGNTFHHNCSFDANSNNASNMTTNNLRSQSSGNFFDQNNNGNNIDNMSHFDCDQYDNGHPPVGRTRSDAGIDYSNHSFNGYEDEETHNDGKGFNSLVFQYYYHSDYY